MHNVAESRRNMRIDLRPKVAIRVMKVELLIAAAALSMCAMMPIYFLKIKPAQELRNMEDEVLKDERELQAHLALEREEVKKLRFRDPHDASLTTFQKN